VVSFFSVLRANITENYKFLKFFSIFSKKSVENVFYAVVAAAG